MQSQIIIEQIIIAGVIISIGALGSWVKVITENVQLAISKLIFNITLPLLIVTTIAKADLTYELLINSVWVVVFSAFSFFLMYWVGHITARIFRLPERQAVVHELHTMFGNIVFLGFPLIAALFPQKESLLYASLYYMISSFIQWTYAVFRLKGQKNVSTHERFKNLLNPNSIAFAVGLLLFLTGIQFPLILEQPIVRIASTTTPLCFLYIGALLARTNIRGILKRYDLYLLSLNKLLLVPLLLMAIINLAVHYLGIRLGDMAKTIIILQVAMPCMNMIVIMARNYGAADDKAAENVFLTTILSMISLPLVYYLVSV